MAAVLESSSSSRLKPEQNEFVDKLSAAPSSPGCVSDLQASVGMSLDVGGGGVLVERFSGCASDCSDERVVDDEDSTAAAAAAN